MTEPIKALAKVLIQLPYDHKWDEEKIKRVLYADDMCSALFDISNKIRGIWENVDAGSTMEKQLEEIQEIISALRIDEMWS